MDNKMEEIRRRLDMATPDPWYVHITVGGLPMIIHDGDEPDAWDLIVDFPRKRENKHNNANFIANARQDIPWLLAEVERLRTALRKIEIRGNSSPHESSTPLANIAHSALAGEE